MSDRNGAVRIGVYTCHCGANIAATVDVKALAEFAALLPNVVLSRDYKYMCSSPGQDLIRQDIRDHQLNRIVVASCSPHLHEHTFRTALKVGGLNPFYFHMVNIREQASWVHENKAQATRKAKDLVCAAVRRVAFHQPLERGRVAIHPDVLVVGGGIAGIHAARAMISAGSPRIPPVQPATEGCDSLVVRCGEICPGCVTLLSSGINAFFLNGLAGEQDMNNNRLAVDCKSIGNEYACHIRLPRSESRRAWASSPACRLHSIRPLHSCTRSDAGSLSVFSASCFTRDAAAVP